MNAIQALAQLESLPTTEHQQAALYGLIDYIAELEGELRRTNAELREYKQGLRAFHKLLHKDVR